ncbi:Uu.00g123740.m01.CDS01 [Anthostomella pinea]|uniref:Uu.00g123740.m01.CDS01 n=1 Tax=Anthostomella pinea TaxID=933095 RepID=A0AAI8YHF4_9PEZI|nr:Uu.00g123740.m01.CDS01 [Anthostomella pinea]
MSSTTRLSMGELNAAALEQFVYTPVNNAMISYLAQAACDVIQCDPNMMPPPQNQTQCPSPPRTPSPKAIQVNDSSLPSLEEFITQLVVSSNVQVPTLMSTLVYLTRLKSRLQPMAKGLRCTTHRIFLAALILAAKYLNDSSPKNKHWATYSNINSDSYSFGFTRTEVNLMEKQLLFLLEWELRITEEDLYRELDGFLAPIRDDIQTKRARRMARRKQREEEEARAWAVAAQYPTPPSSRGSSRSRAQQRMPSPPTETIRMVHEVPAISTPPELIYSYSSSASSSGGSYASSQFSQQHSRSSTPFSEPEVLCIDRSGALYESPVQILPANGSAYSRTGGYRKEGKQLLPYEISADEFRELQDSSTRAKRQRTGRGMWGRMFGGAIHA